MVKLMISTTETNFFKSMSPIDSVVANYGVGGTNSPQACMMVLMMNLVLMATI